MESWCEIAVIAGVGSEKVAVREESLLVSSWRSVDGHCPGHETEEIQLMRQPVKM